MAKNITQKDIERLRPPARGEVWIGDGAIKHLSLRMRANGKATWWLRYRVGGVQKKELLGDLQAMPLGAARAKATTRNAVLFNSDGKVTAVAVPKVVNRTVQGLFDATMTIIADKSSEYRANLKTLWRVHVPAEWKSKPVTAIDAADVDTLLAAIRATGKTVTSNRVRAMLSRMFKLALRWGWTTADPTLGTKPAKEHARERFLSDAELGSLMAVLWSDLAASDSPEDFWNGTEQFHANQRGQSAACLLLIALTGCRPSEAFAARWNQFNADKTQWTKPTTKSGKPHSTPIQPNATKLLNELRSRAERGGVVPVNGLLFPSPRDPSKAMGSLKRYWTGAKKRAGLTDPSIVIYTLRHTFITRLARSGVDLKNLMAITGHASVGVLAKHYMGVDADVQRAALKRAFGQP